MVEQGLWRNLDLRGTGNWQKLHIEELQGLYVSSNNSFIRIIEFRRMRWAGHAARMEGREMNKEFLGGKT